MFRDQFLDLTKIVELFNPKAAAEFKKMNATYMKQHLIEHSEEGCDHKESKAYFIPPEKMSAVDKVTNEMIFKRKDFFKLESGKNLKAVLEEMS